MTTGWIIVNIVAAVVVTLIVGAPAVLIPAMLERGGRTAAAASARPAVRAPERRAAQPGRYAA